jgi:uncharacterized protein
MRADVRRLGVGLSCALAWLVAGGVALAQPLLPVPALSARVIDQTGTLKDGERAALEARLAAFESAHGSQIVVLMVASTKPEPIEDFAQRVGSTWKIGRQGAGDGLLLILAKDDKRLRIDVARALEGAIPDLAAKQIIREAIAPGLTKGDFAGGIGAGLDAIFKRIEGEALPPPAPRGATREDDIEAWLMLGLVGVFVGGAVLKAVLGRTLGSALGGGAAGAIAWWVGGSLVVAAIVALLAAFFLLIARGSRGGRGGGWMPAGGGWGGASPADGGWGGISSGGGGDFGGGGASGGWGDGGDGGD